MYQIEGARVLLGGRRKGGARVLGLPRVSRTVLLLGIVSLLTDVSSEMVATVLPLYLVYTLGFSPLRSASSTASTRARRRSCRVGERLRRRPLAAPQGGGGASATASPRSARARLLVGGSAALRSGRSCSSTAPARASAPSPRDAMISLSRRADELGTAFGVHRALDTAGAMLGPLIAFGLLLRGAARLRRGLHGQLLLRAARPRRAHPLRAEPGSGGGGCRAPAAAADRVSLRAAAGLLRVPRFRTLVVVGRRPRARDHSATASSTWASSAGSTSTPSFFPLLFVGTALVYMLLAVPAGRLADRIGRGKVFLGGYVLLLAGLRPAAAALARHGRARARTSASSARTTRPPTAC